MGAMKKTTPGKAGSRKAAAKKPVSRKATATASSTKKTATATGSPAPLLQKLQLKNVPALALANVPAALARVLSAGLPVPVGGEVDATRGAALLAVHSLAETRVQVPRFLGRVNPAAVVWVAYPKGGSALESDVNRDVLWRFMADLGWGPVRQVALDGTWTALRFKPVD